MNVLVTGGTRGLGLAIVRQLAQQGDTVWVVARQSTPELAELTTRYSGQVQFRSVDLSQPARLDKSLLETEDGKAWPIEGLVNNAATAYDDLATNLNLEPLELMFRVNVFAAMVLSKLAIRNMLLHKTKGALVHISSVSAHTGYKGLAMYAASKGAMEAYSRNLAREWGSVGIRSNCVVPGFMETEMSASLSAEQKEKIYQRTALRQPTNLESVAAMVCHLLGPAAGSITGQSFVVDSGTV
ncbi:MAG: SDR family NAD(P)-dependent oxidoreductase [Planctomycetota bacterium]